MTRIEQPAAARPRPAAEPQPCLNIRLSLGRTHGQPSPVGPPAPRPPVNKRPQQLSVTAIETWFAVPMQSTPAKLAALKPLDEATEASDYGSIVHDGLHRFLRARGAALSDVPSGAARGDVAGIGDAGLLKRVAWWSPDWNIADWVAGAGNRRRFIRAPLAIATGEGVLDLYRQRPLHQPGERTGSILRRQHPQSCHKTGSHPKAVGDGLAPQLLLEQRSPPGGFGPELRGRTAGLIYWHLSGGLDPGSHASVQEEPGGHHERGAGCQGPAVRPDRRVRQAVARLFVAATSRAGTAVLGLRATGPGGRMVSGGG